MSGPKIAAIELTSRCNWNCGFCVSTDDDVEKSAEDCKRIIDGLPPSVKAVVFVGGEPTLHKGLWPLCGYAKKKGYKTKIHTNGWLIKKWSDEQLALVDTINLPLDSMDATVNDSMRKRGALSLTKENIDYLESKKKNVSITTVVTKQNLDSLQKLRDYLTAKNISGWKIFKFHPETGNGHRHKKEFEITDEEFDSAVRGIELENAATYKINEFKNFSTALFY